jgi:hypothetical protein
MYLKVNFYSDYQSLPTLTNKLVRVRDINHLFTNRYTLSTLHFLAWLQSCKIPQIRRDTSLLLSCFAAYCTRSRRIKTTLSFISVQTFTQFVILYQKQSVDGAIWRVCTGCWVRGWVILRHNEIMNEFIDWSPLSRENSSSIFRRTGVRISVPQHK